MTEMPERVLTRAQVGAALNEFQATKDMRVAEAACKRLSDHDEALRAQVAALTGDAKLAMDAIGDRDIRQAERYLTVREDRIAAAFEALDAAPEKQP